MRVETVSVLETRPAAGHLSYCGVLTWHRLLSDKYGLAVAALL